MDLLAAGRGALGIGAVGGGCQRRQLQPLLCSPENLEHVLGPACVPLPLSSHRQLCLRLARPAPMTSGQSPGIAGFHPERDECAVVLLVWKALLWSPGREQMSGARAGASRAGKRMSQRHGLDDRGWSQGSGRGAGRVRSSICRES